MPRLVSTQPRQTVITESWIEKHIRADKKEYFTAHAKKICFWVFKSVLDVCQFSSHYPFMLSDRSGSFCSAYQFNTEEEARIKLDELLLEIEKSNKENIDSRIVHSSRI